MYTSNLDITFNTANVGGRINMFSLDYTGNNITCSNNVGAYSGYFYSQYSHLIVFNSTITNNTATISSSGISFDFGTSIFFLMFYYQEILCDYKDTISNSVFSSNYANIK